MKKVDFFQADKTMSTRVSYFMKVRISDVTRQTRYKKEIKDIEQKIENAPEDLKGSILADRIDELIEELINKKEVIKEEYKKLREEAEKFSFNEADNAFYKAYKNGNVEEGLTEWANYYNFNITDTTLLQELKMVVSGVRVATNKTIIKSGAKTFTQARSKQDVLKTLYSVLCEKMIEAGTIKPEQLPDDIVNFYSKKGGRKNGK